MGGAQLVWSPLFGLRVVRSARVCVAVPALKDPDQWEDLEPWLRADANLDELVSQLGDLKESSAPAHVCLRLIHQSKLIAEKEITLAGAPREPSWINKAMREAQRMMEGRSPLEVAQQLFGAVLGDAPMRAIAAQYGLAWPATRSQIEDAFREQCKKFHPDKVGDTRENNERFARIAAHFKVMRDHSSRAQATT